MSPASVIGVNLRGCGKVGAKTGRRGRVSQRPQEALTPSSGPPRKPMQRQHRAVQRLGVPGDITSSRVNPHLNLCPDISVNGTGRFLS